jgi:hypothetical protein
MTIAKDRKPFLLVAKNAVKLSMLLKKLERNIKPQIMESFLS